MNRVPRPTRRQMLAGTVGVLVTAAVAGAGACTGRPAEPPAPDPLRALVTAALADAELADAVAAAHPPLAAAAGAVAADRRAHALALDAEVTRATPSPTPSSTTAPSAQVAPPDPAAATAALVAAVRAAQDQASALVTGLPRHRAGLVASVAACCASHLAVLS